MIVVNSLILIHELMKEKRMLVSRISRTLMK